MQRALNICSSVSRSLSLSAYKKKSLVKSISPSSIPQQAASDNVVDRSDDPVKRFDHRTNDKSNAMSRAGEIKPVVFRDKLRFCATREILFLSLLSTRPGQEQETVKRPSTEQRQAEKVLRTTGRTVTLLPFDLRAKQE